MNLNAEHRHLVKLDLNDGEAHHLWSALVAATAPTLTTIPTQAFARDLANALNVLLDLGHNDIKEN